jgi:hypothetical protein
MENPELAEYTLLYIEGKGIRAKGYEVKDGFVVCEGSQAVLEEVQCFQKYPAFRGAIRDRVHLIKEGILKREGNAYVFTRDYTLSSPSSAANVILGYSGNLERWKDKRGTSLKEIREREKGS